MRFAPGVLEAIEVEAQHAGVSASQFIASSALAYASFSYARRGGTGAEALERLFEVADRMVREWDGPPPSGSD